MQSDPITLDQQLQINNLNYEFNNKKSKKLNFSFQLDEEVVYQLINSINMFSLLKLNTISEQKDDTTEKYQILQKNGITKTYLNQILMNKIKPVPFNKLNDLKMMLRSALGKVYLGKKSKVIKIDTLNQVKQQEKQQISTKSLYELFNDSIEAYVNLARLLKEVSISTPIQQGFYQEYQNLWKQMLVNLKQEQTNKSDFLNKLFSIWLELPPNLLKTHLQSFCLKSHFAQIDEKKMIKQLISLMVELKIQQCCIYYQLYCEIKKDFIINYKLSDDMREFQDEVLIPKITKSEHIFAAHVLSLFKSNSHLKNRLLNSNQLSPAVGVRVVDLLKQDGREYYNIYMYCLRQHYKSIIYDHKTWYMVEDKLSFNKNFIEWYTEDLIQVLNEKNQHNDQLQIIMKELKHIDNVEDLRLSILQRNEILDFQHSKYKNVKFERISNPIYDNDRFQCSEVIINQIESKRNQGIRRRKSSLYSEYFRLQDYNVAQKDVKFIDKIDQNFEQMYQTLLQSQNKPIGFDTEFRCVSSKYEQQGVSIIQLSTQKRHYIIDFLKIEHEKKFTDFIIELLSNQKYLKIGHTVSSDIKYLTLTLHIPADKKIVNFIDICDLFRARHPNEKFSSLAFLCQKYLGKKLSKYEQRSNWNRRPLKKSQLHYAVLDAFSCVLIYDKMMKQKSNGIISPKKIIKKIQSYDHTSPELMPQTSQQPQIKKQINLPPTKQFVSDIYRSQSLIYHKKYQKLLNLQQPKFLIDNMLKKLSSIMRNCGLDAEYISIRDYNLAIQIAEKQERIILTRDTKFFQRKQNKIPIYLIQQRTDSDRMFQEVKEFFKIDLSKFQTLSRCVKCNGSELIIIPVQQAKNEIKFRYEDSPITQFWRCTKCKQIYWQGGQFIKAKQKYGKLKE